METFHSTGLTISGAISLAVSEVNEGLLKDLGHQLEFIVAETYGEEVSSIRQTAALWTKQVAGYIGPQETCVHVNILIPFNFQAVNQSHKGLMEFIFNGKLKIFL